MTTRILALHGSPRKAGNSIYLARQALAEAKKRKAAVEEVHLADLHINACRGCEACRKAVIHGHCALKDDMQPLYESVQKAHVLLISSPIYWFNYSAQLKLFLDRLYAVHTEKFFALKGKKIGIVLTYADADPFSSGADNAVRSLMDAFRYVGSEIVGIVHGSAWHIGDAAQDKHLVAQAKNLGKLLVK
jgi:multimeric flavodoxin WrbA